MMDRCPHCGDERRKGIVGTAPDGTCYRCFACDKQFFVKDPDYYRDLEARLEAAEQGAK